MLARKPQGNSMLADNLFEAVLSEIKKIRQPDVGTAFFNNAGINESFMVEDLRRSALQPLHMYAYAPTFPQLKTDGSEACYIIPYFGLDGQPLLTPEGYSVFYRQRMKLPQFSKDSRYKQPSADQLIKYNLPGFLPYIHPLTLRLQSDTIYICEGEKKTAAVLKHLGRPAFGIGGCQMWRDPNGSGGIHPWIQELLAGRGFTKVVIVPDGDVFRYDISNAYGTFAHLLKDKGYSVSIVNTGGKVDDLLAEWGSEAADKFDQLGSIAADELVQSSAMLSKRYFLAYRTDKNGVITPHQNTSNISRLLESHPGFGKLWLNLDTNRIYVGENEIIPQQTDVEITNYFQHNLGFDRVNTGQVWQSLVALAKKNQKSPFFDWVKKQVWDGTPRLATWLNRLWGAEQNDFTAELGTKFLVASCARLDKPGTKVDWMMIVIGAQGTGKTSMPGVMFQGCSTILYGDSNDKDFHMKLHSSLCTGFDEMDSFGKREMTFLKAMITSNEDTFRPPYGRSMETMRRKFVLYGSGNREDFLQYDPSGYRRYPVITIKKKLEFEQLKQELPQLWAEAWKLYTTTNIDVSQVLGAGEAAEAHVVASSLEEKMMIAMDRMKDKGKPFMVTELMTIMGIDEKGTNSAVTRELAGYLRKLGYEKKQARTESGPRYVWTKA
jgi:hypothetical protein